MNFDIFQFKLTKKFLQFLHYKDIIVFIFPTFTPEKTALGNQTNPMDISIIRFQQCD